MMVPGCQCDECRARWVAEQVSYAPIPGSARDRDTGVGRKWRLRWLLISVLNEAEDHDLNGAVATAAANVTPARQRRCEISAI